MALPIADAGAAVTPENVAAGWDRVCAIPSPDGVPQQFGGEHKDEQMTQVIAEAQAMGMGKARL